MSALSIAGGHADQGGGSQGETPDNCEGAMPSPVSNISQQQQPTQEGQRGDLKCTLCAKNNYIYKNSATLARHRSKYHREATSPTTQDNPRCPPAAALQPGHCVINPDSRHSPVQPPDPERPKPLEQLFAEARAVKAKRDMAVRGELPTHTPTPPKLVTR